MLNVMGNLKDRQQWTVLKGCDIKTRWIESGGDFTVIT